MIFTGCLQVQSFPPNQTHTTFGKRRRLKFFGMRGSQRIVWRGGEVPQIYKIHMWYHYDIDITHQVKVGDVIYLAGDVFPHVRIDKSQKTHFGVFLNADWHDSRVVGHADVMEGALEAAREAEIRRMTRT